MGRGTALAGTGGGISGLPTDYRVQSLPAGIFHCLKVVSIRPLMMDVIHPTLA
jgi:hypothetical protein